MDRGRTEALIDSRDGLRISDIRNSPQEPSKSLH